MKKDRGSITIITLVTILFMLSFLISTYMIISNRRQAQTEIKRETQEIYESDTENIDAIYNSYFAGEGETIPISTPEQLLKIATGEYIAYGDKIYKCQTNSKYILVNNIQFSVNDYLTKYPEKFNNSTTWIDIEQQIEKGILTGEFDYNGNEIIEIDANGQEIRHSEINFVEYIEGTGTQYIDTGIKPDSSTTFEMSIALNDISSTQAIMGARASLNEVAYDLFIVNGDIRWDYNLEKNFTELSYTTGAKINIVKTGDSITVETNGRTKVINNSNTTISIPYNICIFTIQQNTGLDERYAKMKLYYFKIYKNGVIERELLPALDTNNIPCLYDTVTQQYFYNLGTGTFNYK